MDNIQRADAFITSIMDGPDRWDAHKLSKALADTDFHVEVLGDEQHHSLAPFLVGELQTSSSGKKSVVNFEIAARLFAIMEAMIEEDPQKLADAWASALEYNDGAMFDFLIPKTGEYAIARRAILLGIVTPEMITDWFLSDFSSDGMNPIVPVLKEVPFPDPINPTDNSFGVDLTQDDAFTQLSRDISKAIVKNKTKAQWGLSPEEIIGKLFEEKEAAINKQKAYNKQLAAHEAYQEDLKKGIDTRKMEERKPRTAPTLNKVLHMITQYVLYRGLEELLGGEFTGITSTGIHLLHRKSSTADTRSRKKAAFDKQHEAFKYLVEN